MNLYRSIHEVISAAPADAPLYFNKGSSYSRLNLKAKTAALILRMEALPYTSYALCLDDTFNFTCGLLACLYASKIPVLPGHKVKNLLHDEVCREKRYECILTEEDCPEFKDIPTLNISTVESQVHFQSDLFATAPAKDSSIIMYTSGSTGESKRIDKPLYCMERESVLLQELFKSRLSPELKVAGTVYPWHLYGLTFRIFLPLLAALKSECNLIHFTEELCARTEPLLLITSPAFVSRIDYKLQSPQIRITVSAGGKLNAEAAAQYSQWSGCAFDEIYGSTETGVMATRSYRGQDLLWRPFPGITFDLMEDAVLLHSPLLKAEAYRLDDLLSFEKNGHFSILGRRDRTVKIEEQRVSLTALEKTFQSLPDILECAIVVLQEHDKTYLGAVLRVSEETFAHINNTDIVSYKKQLRQALLQHAEGTILPKKIRFVTCMPVNHMGKRPVAKLKELFNHADA